MALKTVTREFEGFLEDRKSRFLAHLVPVDMFDQRMEELRNRNWMGDFTKEQRQR